MTFDSYPQTGEHSHPFPVDNVVNMVEINRINGDFIHSFSFLSTISVYNYLSGNPEMSTSFPIFNISIISTRYMLSKIFLLSLTGLP